jgi:hypothetical protein
MPSAFPTIPPHVPMPPTLPSPRPFAPLPQPFAAPPPLDYAPPARWTLPPPAIDRHSPDKRPVRLILEQANQGFWHSATVGQLKGLPRPCRPADDEQIREQIRSNASITAQVSCRLPISSRLAGALSIVPAAMVAVQR